MRFFAALLLVLWAAPSLAQFETATVVGTVRDTSGAVVPSAKVTAHQPRYRRERGADE